VNPPAKVESKKRPKSSMELYLIKLIHIDLNAKTVDHVLKQIRKLDWSLPEIAKALESIFLKVWKIRYSNIHLVASMVSGLCRYQEEFTVWLVDALIEEIRMGLETNNFKHNQRRIAIVKYLSELYNYQLIDESLIFDTLYTILTFGHG
jgi:regulator of nonsense transcripts 2